MDDMHQRLHQLASKQGVVHVAKSGETHNFGYDTEGIHFVIRPLSHLVTFPSRVRRLIHGEKVSQGSLSKGASAVSLFLGAVYDYDVLRQGEDRAMRWRSEQTRIANQVVASRGVKSLFDPQFGFVQIRRVDNGIYFEHHEEFSIQFSTGYKPVATRTYRVDQKPQFFDGWEPLSEFEDVWNALETLHKFSRLVNNRKVIEMFVWTNSDKSLVPTELMGQAYEHAMRAYQPLSSHRGFGLLFFRIRDEPNLQINDLEKIALQHKSTPFHIIFAPGKATGKDSRNQPILFLGQLKNAPIWGAALKTLVSCGLELGPQKPTVLLHHNKGSLSEDTFVSVTFGCWDGVWTASAGIHAE